jgi:hypothetical protein
VLVCAAEVLTSVLCRYEGLLRRSQ